ncbi:MAG: bifunctional metallophosphatase/5'-nucleotidase [Acidobacteria bacterium]|nr:MAG: bifunctional metallophosphatase/5'-nucleotidase [Acidobacteriota bacterium]
MKRTGAAVVLFLAASVPAAAARTTVHIVAFSDYHSHALPFVSEGRADQGGIARAVAYLKEARRRPSTVVVSGGDMVNRGSPLWSDVYGCVEWRWLAGLVDVTALGNHDVDYGWDALSACRAAARAPILAANLVDSSGRAILTTDGRPYVVKTVGGVRIGFFALGGPDLARLVRPENLPAGAHWLEPIAVAREIVSSLRDKEKVDAVVFIGHQAREDDEAMARAVPGIDLILGTHSHFKGALTTIPGTRVAFVSPYQYLTYVSDMTLEFDGGRLRRVSGGLVPMDSRRTPDPTVAADVARLQGELVAAHPDRFRVVGRTASGLSDEGVSTGESPIGNWATEVLRRAAGAQAFVATASGFRGGLPAGEVTLEDFYAAIPYTNKVVVAELTGRQVLDLLAASVARTGSDGFCQQSGLRYRVERGRPADVRILENPAQPEKGFASVVPDGVYRIATPDYQARIAAGYKDLFAAARSMTATDVDAHRALLDDLARAPAAALPDGRSGGPPR